MKYVKTFESINKEDIVKAKINFDIIDDIENLSISYLDDGWHIVIKIESMDDNSNVLFYKVVGHSNRIDGIVTNQDYILPGFYFDNTKEVSTNRLIYKFMIFYPITIEEMANNYMAEEEENIDASNDILKILKELYPDENIEVDIYEEEEDEYN